MEKLYVVVRGDLRPGDQLCQSVHAACSWCMAYPGLAARWHDRSNYLVILAVPDEETLCSTVQDLETRYRTCLVREPDLGDEATAFAVEDPAGRYLSSLPLAMREPAMT